LKEIRKKAAELCKEFLEEKAQAYSLLEEITSATVVRNMRKAEGRGEPENVEPDQTSEE
jgi:hypothetical protein